MSKQSQDKIDLDEFYSSESIAQWQEILGKDLHYHCGYFTASEDLETGLKQTVRNFYPDIPLGSRVLDVGCGWGGPAKMLLTERHCDVDAISISAAQVAHCQQLGINSWQQDLEKEPVPHNNQYDLIFSLEMLSHIHEKASFLRHMRSLAPRLIISMNCVIDGYKQKRSTFDSSMVLSTVTEFRQLVIDAGWKIKKIRNRRLQSLRTLILWKNNIDFVYGSDAPPGQILTLQKHINTALKNPILWSHNFPLVDIIAY